MVKKLFKLDDLIGIDHSKSPIIDVRDVNKKCSRLGQDFFLQEGDIDSVPFEEIQRILNLKGQRSSQNDEIAQTLIYLGSPLPDQDFSRIQKYLHDSREIVGSELGVPLDFEIKKVHDTRDYSKESNNAQFLCSSLYQGILVSIREKGSKNIRIREPFIRVAPFIGSYVHHEGEISSDYIMLALDHNLPLAAFSEPMHSIANRIIRDKFKNSTQETSLIEETFVEGAAEFLFNKYRDSLSVPRIYKIKPSRIELYSLSEKSKVWIEQNDLRSAFELFKLNPKKYLEIIKKPYN